MKYKKGFTLIELLAVIVILAIIALIATPIVLNMINSARKKSAESSAYGFIDAIEYNNGFAQTEQQGYTEINGTNLDATSINVKMKGKKPTGGTVTIENGKVTNANICVEGYTVVYSGKEVTSITKGCGGESDTSKKWDKYYTSAQPSGVPELPSDSQIWVQENTTSGEKELCVMFPNKNVCMKYDSNGYGDFDENCTTPGECTIGGYALQKKIEFEEAGATTCIALNDSIQCSSDLVYCNLQSDMLFCSTPVTQGSHGCYIMNNGKILCA